MKYWTPVKLLLDYFKYIVPRSPKRYPPIYHVSYLKNFALQKLHHTVFPMINPREQ